MQKITPFLWFNDQAEEAAEFYVSIFKNSRIKNTARYGEAGAEASGRAEGSVMTVTFELERQEFVALNGGPVFTFSPAVSFVVNCATQEELDNLWDRLSAGGPVEAQQCGWLQDRYGLSWQIVPAALEEMLQDSNSGKAERVIREVMQMKKIDLRRLRQAYGKE